MKKMLIGLFLTLSCLNAFANSTAGDIAKTKTNKNENDKQALVKLFNQEAAKKDSALTRYLNSLKNNPENQGYEIDGEITDQEIVRIESGKNANSFEINYLIIIRAGYKSNTFPVGYLSATSTFNIEDESGSSDISITKAAKVTIE